MKSCKIYGLSLLRLFATCFIFTCHVLQAYENSLCYYFNVGVPIFLAISGYIYGNKDIKAKEFYKDRAKRILIPYYFMIVIIVVCDIIRGYRIKPFGLISSLLCLQWSGISIPGCGHLWYITCILLCYLLTPLLQKIRDKKSSKNKILKTVPAIVLICFVQFVLSCNQIFHFDTDKLFRVFGVLYYPIVTYIISYFTGSIIRTRIHCKQKWVVMIIAVIAFISFWLLAILDVNYSIIGQYTRELIKMLFAFVLLALFANYEIYNHNLCKLLDISDKYSFYCYLTHHLFILGPLAVVTLTPYIFINVFAAIFLTTCLSVLLFNMTKVFSTCIFSHKQKDRYS